jgi:hypothetical protein
MGTKPRTFPSYGLADNATDRLIQAQHVQKNPSYLRQVEAADRRTSRHVRLEDVGQNLDIIKVA